MRKLDYADLRARVSEITDVNGDIHHIEVADSLISDAIYNMEHGDEASERCVYGLATIGAHRIVPRVLRTLGTIEVNSRKPRRIAVEKKNGRTIRVMRLPCDLSDEQSEAKIAAHRANSRGNDTSASLLEKFHDLKVFMRGYASGHGISQQIKTARDAWEIARRLGVRLTDYDFNFKAEDFGANRVKSVPRLRAVKSA